MESAWNGTVVTDHSLTEAVRLLRNALDDNSQQPTYIQTLHRRGYRFIAPVSVDGARSGDSAHSEPVLADVGLQTSSSWPRRRLFLSGLAVVAVVAVVVALWAGLSSRQATPPPTFAFSVQAPPGGVIPANEQSVAISPDGSTLVYALRMPGYHSRGSLYARSLNDGVSRSLEEFRRRPFFSPDGGHLVVIEGGLTIMSLADGEKETFCEECFKGLGFRSGAGGTWGEDGTIVVAHGKLW